MSEIYDYAICTACSAEGPYNGEPVCPFCGGELRNFDPQAEGLPPQAQRWRSAEEADLLAQSNGHPSTTTEAIGQAITQALMAVVPSRDEVLRAAGDRFGFDLAILPETEEDRRLGRVRVTAVRRPRPVTLTITVGANAS